MVVRISEESGRGDWIRTSDPLRPRQVRYQAALRPDSPLILPRPQPQPDDERLRTAARPHYTPKHGSWLNPAEIEASLWSRECHGRQTDNHRFFSPYPGRRGYAICAFFLQPSRFEVHGT